MDLKDATAAERAVDIKRVVSSLRKQRAGMVQTPGQYLFCHQVCAFQLHVGKAQQSSS